MFIIKFPTKRIFRIFPILRTDGMAPFFYLIYRTTLVLCTALTLGPHGHPVGTVVVSLAGIINTLVL